MSDWWRRNRGALLAIVILVPLMVGIAGGWEFWNRVQGRPTFPVTAAVGSSLDFGGITFGPATAEVTSIPDAQLPPNTKIIAVSVRVDRHDATTSCSIPVLRELTGKGRLWEADSQIVPWNWRLNTLCPAQSTRNLFPGGAFSIDVPFIVPDDVDGELGVEFTIPNQLPRYARLVVVP